MCVCERPLSFCSSGANYKTLFWGSWLISLWESTLLCCWCPHATWNFLCESLTELWVTPKGGTMWQTLFPMLNSIRKSSFPVSPKNANTKGRKDPVQVKILHVKLHKKIRVFNFPCQNVTKWGTLCTIKFHMLSAIWKCEFWILGKNLSHDDEDEGQVVDKNTTTVSLRLFLNLRGFRGFSGAFLLNS